MLPQRSSSGQDFLTGEVLAVSTSNRKEVLAAGRIVAQGAARSRKKLPACGRKKKFLHMHYFWAVL